MYHLITYIVLKTFDPYYRRYLTSDSLNAIDYMYLETFIYSFVLILFIIFKYFSDKKQSIETFKNLQKVEMKDVLIMCVMSFFFIYSTLMIYQNEHTSSAFVNTIVLRGGTLIGILLIGIFFYEEKYNWKQIVGIIFSFFGIYLLMNK